MRAEWDKANAKLSADRMRLTTSEYELKPDDRTCHLILVSGGSCSIQWGDQTVLATPGCAVLLGPGGGFLRQNGYSVPELLGCSFSVAFLGEMRTNLQKDYTHLFAKDGLILLYGPPQWSNRLRTLMELLHSAENEADCPGGLYLALLLHYTEQEDRNERAAKRPRNETVEQICAYLAENYQQKFSLTEVAARFYLSPYYLSRLFRRVTGQSIVDYINGRRIEAAQQLLENTTMSVSDVAEQTGFASAAHFRRVFREVMGVGPLQYRKGKRG